MTAPERWACSEGHTTGNVFVFEMAYPGTIERFEFDTAGSTKMARCERCQGRGLVHVKGRRLPAGAHGRAGGQS